LSEDLMINIHNHIKLSKYIFLITQAKFSKSGDILACSVLGINCNVLRFYKH
jgi:hypothetical protein